MSMKGMVSVVQFLCLGMLFAQNLHAAKSNNVQPALQLKTGVHHLVDDALLDSTNANATGTYFALGSVQKDTDHPLIVPEYPWEPAVHFYNAAVFINATYSNTGAPQWIVYYACSDTILFFNPISVCVANSSDGKEWRKPLLPYHLYNGSMTNIVFVTEMNTFLGSAAVDYTSPHDALVTLVYESTVNRYVHTATSADGYAFNPSSADPNATASPPFEHFADTQVSILKDTWSDPPRWLAYGRLDKTLPNSTDGCQGGYGSERWNIQTSKECPPEPAFCNVSDPTGWVNTTIALSPGLPDPYSCVDSYNPAAQAMPDAGTGGLYLMLPSSFRHMPLTESGAPDVRAGGNDGYMDIRLAVSRDAVNWSYPSRDPFIPRGLGARDPGSGLYNATGSDRDAGMLFATANGLVDPDLALPVAPISPSNWVYQLYWGSQTTHAGGGAYLYRYWPGAFTGIFRAKMRREGWAALATWTASVDWPTGEGHAYTVPLLLPTTGQKAEQALVLRMNAEIAVAGGLTVSILDAATMQPIPGFSSDKSTVLHGNGVRQLVSWNSTGAGLVSNIRPIADAGSPIVLQLDMVHAKLFAWELAFI